MKKLHGSEICGATLAGLITLWKETFKDTDEWLNAFLCARAGRSDVYYIEMEGKIVSALWYTPTPALICKEEQSVMLITGVATDSAWRCRGLMGTLIADSLKSYPIPVVLYPALRSYYEAKGFISTSKTFTYSLPEVNLSFREKPDYLRLDQIYRQSIARRGGLLRDEYAWREILDSNYLIYTEGAYALFSPQEGAIREAGAMDASSAQALLPHIGGRVTVIPGSALDDLLKERGCRGEETLLGMASVDNGIYISEQY